MPVAIKNNYNSFENRPWGGFEIIHAGDNYKIKRLYVSPNEGTSLQTHQHRSEHWVIESGAAKITIGERVSYLLAGASVSVPKNIAHRIENEGAEMLVIFEVQFGKCLREDDIIRLEDKYGRV